MLLPHYANLLATFRTTPNEGLSAFFASNTEHIDTLIQLYNEYNHHLTLIQIDRIKQLKAALKTDDPQWTDIDGLELEYHYPYPSISIIAGFETTQANPLGKFNIYLTTPSIQSWNHYEDTLIALYPDIDPQIAGNKTIIKINTIENGTHEQFLQALTTAHATLSKLTTRKFSPSLTSY
jgi:hypothetical protein